MIDGLFDAGLQPERTTLAWRRTALSLGTGSIVSIRLFPAVLDSALWVIPGLVGVGIATVIWVSTGSQYRDVNNVLMGRTRRGLPGAGLILFLTCVSVLTGCVGVVVVLVVATS